MSTRSSSRSVVARQLFARRANVRGKRGGAALQKPCAEALVSKEREVCQVIGCKCQSTVTFIACCCEWKTGAFHTCSLPVLHPVYQSTGLQVHLLSDMDMKDIETMLMKFREHMTEVTEE